MTVVVGLVGPHGVLLGCDSCYSNEVFEQRVDEKVFEKTWESGQRIGLGVAGSQRFTNIVRYVFDPDEPYGDDAMRWMVTRFVTNLRDACDEAMGATVHDKRWDWIKDGAVLVALGRRLFAVWAEDFQVYEPTNGYTAIGCGAMVALGAMAATHGLDDHERVGRALYAACEHAPGVTGPTSLHFFAGRN